MDVIRNEVISISPHTNSLLIIFNFKVKTNLTLCLFIMLVNFEKSLYIMIYNKNMDDVIKNIFQQLNDLRNRIDKIESQLAEQSASDTDAKDSLFPEAINIAKGYDKVSASLFQRKLSIGYARAARILDQLEEEGIIGPGEGAKPRKVLKNK